MSVPLPASLNLECLTSKYFKFPNFEKKSNQCTGMEFCVNAIFKHAQVFLILIKMYLMAIVFGAVYRCQFQFQFQFNFIFERFNQ